MLAPRGLLGLGFAIRRDVFGDLDEFCGLVLWLGVGIAHKVSHTNPLAQATLIIYVAGFSSCPYGHSKSLVLLMQGHRGLVWWFGRKLCMICVFLNQSLFLWSAGTCHRIVLGPERLPCYGRALTLSACTKPSDPPATRIRVMAPSVCMTLTSRPSGR